MAASPFSVEQIKEAKSKIVSTLANAAPMTLGQLTKAVSLDKALIRKVVAILRKDGKLGSDGQRRSTKYSVVQAS